MNYLIMQKSTIDIDDKCLVVRYLLSVLWYLLSVLFKFKVILLKKNPMIKGLFVWAFGQLQLLPTTLNGFQLLPTAKC